MQVVMLYCGLGHALRGVAGDFALLEERISGTAIKKRQEACGPRLEALLQRMLPKTKNRPEQSRVLVVDGPSLQGPGAEGTDFRLHLALDLVAMTLHRLHAALLGAG
jgi:hypothetical protein